MKCVYCCQEISKSNYAREHVPPKSFFLKGAPNLITISSCRECNNKKSKDDEIIKITLLMSDLAQYNQDFDVKIHEAIRGLCRPEKSNFRQKMIDDSHYVITGEDIKYAYLCDHALVENWMGTNGQGLLVHEGHVDNCNYPHSTYFLNLLNKNDANELDLLTKIMSFVEYTEPVIKGNSEFKYWISDEKLGFIIVQCFYEEFFFLTMVAKA